MPDVAVWKIWPVAQCLPNAELSLTVIDDQSHHVFSVIIFWLISTLIFKWDLIFIDKLLRIKISNNMDTMFQCHHDIIFKWQVTWGGMHGQPWSWLEISYICHQHGFDDRAAGQYLWPNVITLSHFLKWPLVTWQPPVCSLEIVGCDCWVWLAAILVSWCDHGWWG